MPPEDYLQKLISYCRQNQKFSEAEKDKNSELIQKAFNFAMKAHQGQKRLSGEDYIFHCLAAAEIVIDLKVDCQTITATIMHDVLDGKDGSSAEYWEKELKKEFDKEIVNLVKAVTKVGKIKYRGIERAVENLRKMFLATAEDIRVVLIKLADRLHNMRTLSAQPPEKQKRIALETLEIFAPLADRLGIGKIKRELEDLSFKYLMPGEFNWLINQVQDQYEQREKYLEKIIPIVKKELQKDGINPLEIHWRAKNYYSLYRKLKRYEMNLSRIYDLVALRIIVPTIEDCYAALGVIHKTWRPLPGRVKDYIALPKPNGYQSLHTTVFCDDGKITEFQIRTPQMHEEAERGIAAHWFYSEQKGLKSYIKKLFKPAPQKEIIWIKQLQEWQKENQTSPEEFFRSLKIDFFKDRIFVFTPKGDVIDLPEGATPVDFAFSIHSDIGRHCQGAKVDGKLVALDTPLQNGQVVEIITNKNARPNHDWLKFVKTHQAQNRIRQWLNKNKEELWEERPKKEIQVKTAEPPKIITPPYSKILKAEVEIAGDPKISTQLGKCCSPKPPDAICGYITLNQRITIHRCDCKNLKKLKDQTRFIQANWKTD